MFYCYVLRSQKTGRRYVGSCENLTERIRRHNAGDSKATKHGAPLVLVHSESFASRPEAARRERYYKTGRGRDELDRYCRAVAAATGRGFKSHQPDNLCCVCAGASKRVTHARRPRSVQGASRRLRLKPARDRVAWSPTEDSPPDTLAWPQSIARSRSDARTALRSPKRRH